MLSQCLLLLLLLSFLILDLTQYDKGSAPKVIEPSLHLPEMSNWEISCHFWLNSLEKDDSGKNRFPLNQNWKMWEGREKAWKHTKSGSPRQGIRPLWCISWMFKWNSETQFNPWKFFLYNQSKDPKSWTPKTSMSSPKGRGLPKSSACSILGKHAQVMRGGRDGRWGWVRISPSFILQIGLTSFSGTWSSVCLIRWNKLILNNSN